MAVYLMKKDYRFRFGKYRAKRVDEVLAKGIYGREFIAWIYAVKEDIDFSDDILQELGLDKIEKPGINPEVHAKFLEGLTSEERAQLERVRMGDWQSQRNSARRMRRFYEYTMQRKRDDAESTKATLAWKNQGH